jgi:hypothetical protein
MVLLGNLAIRTGKKIEWDGRKMKARNVNVSRLVRPPRRKGWEV